MQDTQKTYPIQELYDDLPCTLVELADKSGLNEVTVARVRDGKPARRSTVNKLLRAMSAILERELSLRNVTGINVQVNKRLGKNESNKVADTRELEQVRSHIQDVESKLADAHMAHIRQAKQQREAVSPPSDRPTSSRRPTYQIYLKHEPGPCPRLPEGFAYIDMDKSIEPRQCPIHRIFARPCAIAIARQHVERLKQEGPGIIQVWLDKDGYGLPRDSWRKEHGRWVRDD